MDISGISRFPMIRSVATNCQGGKNSARGTNHFGRNRFPLRSNAWIIFFKKKTGEQNLKGCLEVTTVNAPPCPPLKAPPWRLHLHFLLGHQCSKHPLRRATVRATYMARRRPLGRWLGMPLWTRRHPLHCLPLADCPLNPPQATSCHGP